MKYKPVDTCLVKQLNLGQIMIEGCDDKLNMRERYQLIYPQVV